MESKYLLSRISSNQSYLYLIDEILSLEKFLLNVFGAYDAKYSENIHYTYISFIKWIIYIIEVHLRALFPVGKEQQVA